MNVQLSGITARAQFWKNLLSQWWGWAFIVIWTLFSTVTTIRDNFLPEAWQRRLSVPEFLQFISQWGWQIWLIGLLIITLVMVLEGAYRKWAEEHHHVEELTKEITKLTEVKITCVVYGIPLGLPIEKRLLLFVPEVTITNSSSTKAASIGVELHVPIGGHASVVFPPESIPIKEWEQSTQSSRNQCLIFPLNLPPGHAAGGYIAFGADRLRGIASTPDFKNCEVQFTNLHTGQIIHTHPLRFIINI